MDERRIERALRDGPPDEAAYVPQFVDRGLELNAEQTGGVDADTTFAGRVARPVVRVQRRSEGFPYVMPIAAALVIALAGLALRAWPGPAAPPTPSPAAGDLLSRIQAAGVIRVVVSNKAPQVAGIGGTFVGFDVDVANALAGRLLVRAEVTAASPDTILQAGGDWDLAFPSSDLTNVPSAFARSTPYYAWPSWLVVAEASDVVSADQLAGQPICVVTGSAAAEWVSGDLPDGAEGIPPPPGITLVEAVDDSACFVAIASGAASGAVTATLLDTELASRGVRIVGSDPALIQKRRALIQGTGGDVASLVAAVDEAFAAMLASGELADISRRSFGGRDLTEGIR